jgi:hypothetical protein
MLVVKPVGAAVLAAVVRVLFMARALELLAKALTAALIVMPIVIYRAAAVVVVLRGQIDQVLIRKTVKMAVQAPQVV